VVICGQDATKTYHGYLKQDRDHSGTAKKQQAYLREGQSSGLLQVQFSRDWATLTAHNSKHGLPQRGEARLEELDTDSSDDGLDNSLLPPGAEEGTDSLEDDGNLRLGEIAKARNWKLEAGQALLINATTPPHTVALARPRESTVYYGFDPNFGVWEFATDLAIALDRFHNKLNGRYEKEFGGFFADWVIWLRLIGDKKSN
jgi:hypothetical protein